MNDRRRNAGHDCVRNLGLSGNHPNDPAEHRRVDGAREYDDDARLRGDPRAKDDAGDDRHEEEDEQHPPGDLQATAPSSRPLPLPRHGA
jgi:hypothetical protein